MLNLNEKQTRKQYIDETLNDAGWDVTDKRQVGIEVPADGFDATAWYALENPRSPSSVSAKFGFPGLLPSWHPTQYVLSTGCTSSLKRNGRGSP